MQSAAVLATYLNSTDVADDMHRNNNSVLFLILCATTFGMPMHSSRRTCCTVFQHTQHFVADLARIGPTCHTVCFNTNDTNCFCMACRLSFPARCCTLCQEVPGCDDCLVTLHTGGHGQVLQGAAGVCSHLLCCLPHRCVRS